ncbi:MAG: hypothetical protein ACE1ZP_03930, partial [Myxococcota bacterium]
MIQPEEETVSRLIIVVQNWFLITAHADLVELASDADLLNLVEADEHEQRLTQTRGVIEAQRRHAARLREG